MATLLTVKEIRQRMDDLKIRQVDVCKDLGYSKYHINAILNRRLECSPKLRKKLSYYIAEKEKID